MTSTFAFVTITLVLVILNLTFLRNLNLNLIDPEDLGKIVLIIVALLTGLIWGLLKIKTTRRFIDKTLGSMWKELKKYRNRPQDVLLSIFHAFVYTLLGISVLYATSMSLGMDITISQVFFVYILGNTLATLVPIPGGVGAAEAGLYAGFTLLGYESSVSIAAVTVYRLISFWLPAIPGFIFFVNLRKDLLANFSLSMRSKS